MRSWINFSPIGQASLLSKKVTSSSNDQNDTVESVTQLEGLFTNILSSTFLF